MTKVQTRVKLSRPLTEEEFKRIYHLHAVYGMLNTQVLPSGEELFIEYHSSRLSRDEVRGTLEQHGIPIV